MPSAYHITLLPPSCSNGYNMPWDLLFQSVGPILSNSRWTSTNGITHSNTVSQPRRSTSMGVVYSSGAPPQE